jgi:phosphate/sulfate permease
MKAGLTAIVWIGLGVTVWSGLGVTGAAITLSPLLGFFLAVLLVLIVSWTFVRSTPSAVDNTFRTSADDIAELEANVADTERASADVAAGRNRTRQRYLETVQDPRDAQCHDHERVKPAPPQPIEPRRDIGRDHRLACRRWRISWERGCRRHA